MKNEDYNWSNVNCHRLSFWFCARFPVCFKFSTHDDIKDLCFKIVKWQLSWNEHEKFPFGGGLKTSFLCLQMGTTVWSEHVKFPFGGGLKTSLFAGIKKLVFKPPPNGNYKYTLYLYYKYTLYLTYFPPQKMSWKL